MAASTQETYNVRELLADLCARNAVTELHVESPPDDCVTARVRLIDMNDDVVFCDRPQNVNRDVELRAGQSVTAYVKSGDERWAFDTVVVKSMCMVRLNSKQRVVGMSLEIPDAIRDQQRRRDYRISLAGKNIDCEIQREHQTHRFACSVNRAAIFGRLVNLSARGFGVVVDAPHWKHLNYGDRVFCHFRLSGLIGRQVLLGEVRHQRPIRGGHSAIVGLRLCETPIAPVAGLSSRLNRFIAQEQRNRLRRRR